MFKKKRRKVKPFGLILAIIMALHIQQELRLRLQTIAIIIQVLIRFIQPDLQEIVLGTHGEEHMKYSGHHQA